MKVVERKRKRKRREGREAAAAKHEIRWAENEVERDSMVYDMHLGYDA